VPNGYYGNGARETGARKIVIPQVDLKARLAETEPEWRNNLERVIQRAQFVLGEESSSFEREFAHATHARFAVGVGNGTDALELCLREMLITSPDQEVITSPLTAPFTGLAVLRAGASVRFADVDPETLLLDPRSVKKRLTDRTAAIIPVHLYGQPCPLAQFCELGMPVIQDACQAHGATHNGRPLTDYSVSVAYSFYPTKNLGCLGDGGAVTTNDESTAERIRVLRNGGRCGDHVSRVKGVNSRLDEVQACFLRAFLPCLGKWNNRRACLANLYDELLGDCPGVRLFKRSAESVNHLYVIRAERREALRDHLFSHGISTAVHYPVPLPMQAAFADCRIEQGDLPNAEKACTEILSLPLWPDLHPDSIAVVARTIRSFYE
jgi:dTDP-4-amino-4,6-dideoxygalactose transaminase